MTSDKYVELKDPAEIAAASELSAAWKSPQIPSRQWSVVEKELAEVRRGFPAGIYRVAADCLRHAGFGPSTKERALLDMGAGCAHYRDALGALGLSFDYRACDYSDSFRDHALARDPSIRYDVADAAQLPYRDGEFPAILHGGVLMHMPNWRDALREAVRVSSEWILFHRTPFVLIGPTQYWRKEAYGIPCFETWFSESELVKEFKEAGLRLAMIAKIFENRGTGHRSYLCRKG